MKIRFNSQKLKYNSVATAFIVLFIAVVILINVLFSFLSDRYLLSIDLTNNSFYDLSEETKSTLDQLSTDITITILDREDFTYTNSKYASSVDGDYLNAFPEIFSRYEVLSNGKVTVRYVDPYTNPTAISDYTTEFGTPSVTDVIVESEKRSVLLSSSDFFELETNYSSSLTSSTYQTVAGLQAEQKLTSAILYSITDDLPVAVFLEGHGETTMESLSSLLVAGNYELTNINLLTDDLPENTSLVIIAGPTTDFASSEINKLDAYFDQGGNAIFLAAPNTQELPNLEVYLEEWGISYNRELVMDSQRNLMYQLNVLPYVQEVTPEDETSDLVDLTSELVNSDALVVAANSRSINILWPTNVWRSTYPILCSSDTSYAKSLDAEEMSLNQEDGDPVGPFDLAVLTVHYDPNEDGVTSKILFASLDLASDNYLSTSTYLNQQLFVTMINNFNPMTQSVIISSKTLATDDMSVQAWQATIIFWLLIVVLPILFLIAGLMVWIRRRNM